VVCDHNRRQGMSIIDADGVVVRDSVFKNTQGAPPQAGIDVEPNAGDVAQNLQIKNSQFLDNAGDGVLVSVPFAQVPQGKVANLTITGNLMRGNGVGRITGNFGSGIGIWSPSVTGVTATKNTIQDNRADGILLWETIGQTSDRNAISGSGRHGIFLRGDGKGSNSNTLSTNNITSSSQKKDLDADGVRVAFGSSSNTIVGNIVRLGSTTNRPRFGLQITDSSCAGNKVLENDLQGSGALGSFVDLGTGTTASGNKL
jgi:hypothetical protein